MKKLSLATYILLAALVLGLNACATTNDLSDSAPQQEQRDPAARTMSNPNSLADILIRLPGVIVDESGLATRVSVRGGMPLYVVDGMRMGRSYQSVAMAVNVNDIASVEVLRNVSETAMYGRDGAYGVIVINTRRG